jgi:hypothetical protein
LIAGNFYPYRVQLGHCDASLGLILKTESGKISAIAPGKSGLYLSGDVRNVRVLKSKNKSHYLLVSANNGPLKLYQVPNE